MTAAIATDPIQPRPEMVWVPGGEFHMGSDRHYPEERPVHLVRVDGFWMDRTPVTNREFARFIKETGYVRSPRSDLTLRTTPAHSRTC